MRFYHGSGKKLKEGDVLTGRGDDYEASWSSTDFYEILERERPEEMTAHKEAVFMVGHPDDVDLAGGSTEWCAEMIPEGVVSRHDLNWSSEISLLLSEGKAKDSQEVREAAEKYWRGEPHPNEQVWEYLARSAKVVRVEEWETMEVAHETPTDEEWAAFKKSRKAKRRGPNI